jgi:hypothetical protein
MKAIVLAIALALLAASMLACAPSPENTALQREAMWVALAEYQRLHPPPVHPEK